MNQHGETALVTATCHSYNDIVGMLINAKANVEAVDKEKNTSLILATMFGFKDIAISLINAGANIEATNTHGKTALNIYNKQCEPEAPIVKSLLVAQKRAFARLIQQLATSDEDKGKHANSEENYFVTNFNINDQLRKFMRNAGIEILLVQEDSQGNFIEKNASKEGESYVGELAQRIKKHTFFSAGLEPLLKDASKRVPKLQEIAARKATMLILNR